MVIISTVPNLVSYYALSPYFEGLKYTNYFPLLSNLPWLLFVYQLFPFFGSDYVLVSLPDNPIQGDPCHTGPVSNAFYLASQLLFEPYHPLVNSPYSIYHNLECCYLLACVLESISLTRVQGKNHVCLSHDCIFFIKPRVWHIINAK